MDIGAGLQGLKRRWVELLDGTRFEDSLLDDVVYDTLDSLSDTCYNVKDYMFPHNIQKVESLNRSYCDPREFLLHANFQVLKDYVEKEKALEIIDWDWNETHSAVGKEIRHLYYWWTVVYPNRPRPYGGVFQGRRFVEDEAENDPLGLGTVDIPGVSGKRMGAFTEEYHEYTLEQDALDEAQMKEEQEMLHRLIDIREYLWT